jgi:hypothetical protein
MGEVIWATFPQYRKPQEVALERMASDIFRFALEGGPLPTYGFNDTAPSEMPPEAS